MTLRFSAGTSDFAEGPSSIILLLWIIVEFKAVYREPDLEKEADLAINQINFKNYEQELKNKGI